jgi:membrane protease YdiL (CAAX protease family)
MQLAVVVAGALAQAAAWWFVSSGKASVWRVLPIVMGAMAAAALLTRSVVWAGPHGATRTLAVGVASGLTLYGATLVFVLIVARWKRVHRMVTAQYGWADGTSRFQVMALTLIIIVPSEEIFWRGLVQGRLSSTMALASAAGLAWVIYLVVNVPARSMPILAAAVVGGALWVGLAWWSRGICASLVSHMVWTGLMLIAPPGAAKASEDP